MDTFPDSAQSVPTSVRRPFKHRLIRALLAFLALQAVVAFIVSHRSKAAQREREAKRPKTYPSRSFEEVEVSGIDRVRLYMRGDELLDDIITAIDAATQYVYIETFIWIDDSTGQRLRDALGRATARGVRCHVIYDWLLSSRSLEDGFMPQEVRWFAFRPITGRDALRASNLLRDHRKIVVVDGEVGFVGGYNFGDEYRDWRDTHIRITGETVAEIENAFVDFWNQHRPLLAEPLPSAERRSWDPQISIHRNDPSLAIFPIRGMQLEAIDRATERIWITNAYFVPDRAYRGALIEAARRGVDVRVMLPANSNHPLTDVLAHGMFDEMLASGVRVFLYKNFMVHAKTATIDGSWSTVGTANLDRWSMIGNYEINAEIRSSEVAAQLEELFLHDLANCFEVRLDVWRRRPMPMRISEQTLKSLAPLM